MSLQPANVSRPTDVIFQNCLRRKRNLTKIAKVTLAGLGVVLAAVAVAVIADIFSLVSGSGGRRDC